MSQFNNLSTDEKLNTIFNKMTANDETLNNINLGLNALNERVLKVENVQLPRLEEKYNLIQNEVVQLKKVVDTIKNNPNMRQGKGVTLNTYVINEDVNGVFKKLTDKYSPKDFNTMIVKFQLMSNNQLKLVTRNSFDSTCVGRGLYEMEIKERAGNNGRHTGWSLGNEKIAWNET